MQRPDLDEPTPPPTPENGAGEAPVHDAPRALANRVLGLARARPLAAFAAVLVAGYVLGRILRR